MDDDGKSKLFRLVRLGKAKEVWLTEAEDDDVGLRVPSALIREYLLHAYGP